MQGKKNAQAYTWKDLEGYIAPEVLCAPRTGSDPTSTWPQVHSRVIGYSYFVSFSEDETLGSDWSARARGGDPGRARGAPVDARKAVSFVSRRGGKASPRGRGSVNRYNMRKL